MEQSNALFVTSSVVTIPDGVNVAHPTDLFIGGRWLTPSSRSFIEVVSPNTEQVVAVVAEAGEADMDAAVAAARKAFDDGPWPNYSPQKRAAVLRKMSTILSSRNSELAAAFVAQVGALASFAPFAAAGGSATFAKYADIADSFEWVKAHSSTVPGHEAMIVREPVGVVAAIAPWNMPYAIMAQKVAPALAAGCSVIMKPSPETPLEAYLICEAAEAAGLPAGVLNMVPAHRDAADYLVRNPGVDKISFTGSTAAGRRIASVAGERIARVTLELGGKSPAIMLDDFSTAEAGKLLARTISVLSGQVCAMLSRAIVPADRHDEIAEAIAAEMRQIKVGYSDQPGTEMGPVAMSRQLDRIERYVRTGIEAGATLVTGGGRPKGLDVGYFFEPTLFADVKNTMTIAQEEIFGPVLALIPAENLDDAVRIANQSAFGLNASVLTHDRKSVFEVGRRIRAGNVAQNGMKADFDLPFGGFKQSGVGREGGVEGLAPYYETKVILVEQESAGGPAA
jgi:aldehyde dehydrogenase (NAD+)